MKSPTAPPPREKLGSSPLSSSNRLPSCSAICTDIQVTLPPEHRSLPGHFSCLLIVETTVKPPPGAWSVKWHRRTSGSAEPGHLSARYHRPSAWDRS